jgi:hypothetical protein
MALIAPQTIPGSAATALTFAAANSGGDTVAYNKAKKQLLLVKTGSGTRTVTITAVRTSVQTGRDVAALANIQSAIGADQIRSFPITPGYVGTDGLVAITYTSVTNTEVALLEF